MDGAENNFEIANITNYRSVELIAKWSNENNCKLIHFSTDYVYDGNSLLPYVESDKTNPLNKLTTGIKNLMKNYNEIEKKKSKLRF